MRNDGNRLSLDLTPQEMSTLLFDQSESIYFAVFGPGGKFLTGNDVDADIAGAPHQIVHHRAAREFKPP